MNKTYIFDTNRGTVTITVDGEYSNGNKDITAWIDGSEYVEQTFEDMDDAGLVTDWLQEHGVIFSNPSVAYYVYSFIQSGLIDRDATEEDILAGIKGRTNKDLRAFCERHNLTTSA